MENNEIVWDNSIRLYEAELILMEASFVLGSGGFVPGVKQSAFRVRRDVPAALHSAAGKTTAWIWTSND